MILFYYVFLFIWLLFGLLYHFRHVYFTYTFLRHDKYKGISILICTIKNFYTSLINFFLYFLMKHHCFIIFVKNSFLYQVTSFINTCNYRSKRIHFPLLYNKHRQNYSSCYYYNKSSNRMCYFFYFSIVFV